MAKQICLKDRAQIKKLVKSTKQRMDSEGLAKEVLDKGSGQIWLNQAGTVTLSSK